MLAVRVLSRTIGFKPVAQCLPSAYFGAQQCTQFSSKKIVHEKDDTQFDLVPIQDIASSIDTTLTEEQKAYVAKIKKQIRGGHKSPRSLYREVPRPDEIVGLGNFMPRIADNAEALIDYALSHIPPRAGPRGSRRKKRMEIKHASKRKYDAISKKQQVEANLRKHAKQKRINKEVKAVREEVKKINEIARMKAEVRAATAAAKLQKQ